MMISVQVCIPHTARDYFDYLSDTAENLPAIGTRVMVPFRNQEKMGIVLGHNDTVINSNKLKTISRQIDEQAIISTEVLELCVWMGRYYQSPLSEVLALALPKNYRQGAVQELLMIKTYSPLPELKPHKALGKKQQALLEFMQAYQQPCYSKTLRAEGYTKAQLDALLNAGLISETLHPRLDWPTLPNTSPAHTLHPEQAAAVAEISANLHHFKRFLLHGITGSGKTEVYLQVITQCIDAGKQVLVLVPEIGLTPQLISRFRTRFPYPLAVIHSQLNETERQQAWQLACEGLVPIVLGTRSALFTPMPRLGLIIIDEEHDLSFKQQEGVRYSARDSALKRAQNKNIPIIMGSATPSLESLYNCQQQKFTLLQLTHKAMTDQHLPINLIDLRSQNLAEGISSVSLQAMSEHLARGNQVLVFINRRGFAPVLLCHDCGWMADCKACDSHLTYHQSVERLMCHHCGHQERRPYVCLSCKSKNIISVGTGTQRVEAYLNQQFPEYNILRMDRDEVQKKEAWEQHLAKIDSGEIQIIVGTQMLAKGHHFPKLTLVLILDNDQGLSHHDFRALERMGQLLTQVSGRAGRAEHAGQVLIQTHQPDHPLLQLLLREGYEAFAQELLRNREAAGLPPHHHMALLRAQGKDLNQVKAFMQGAKNYLNHNQIQVLGPAPAPLARKAGMHRLQLLIKAPQRAPLHHALSNLRLWLTQSKINQGIRYNLDIDPMDLS